MGRNLVRGAGVVGGAVVTALLFVSVALAGGSSSESGYSNTAGVVQKTVGTKHTTHASGTLPFTGVNLALFVAAGVVLVVLGVALRRVSRGA
jgi:hypothetical protein